ncbi:MAG: efflux RND transporter periplasmic adaptor subunit [Burkholderiaceae bacterium]
MATSKKQRIVIALIVVAGLLGGAAVLVGGRNDNQGGGGDAHATAHPQAQGASASHDTHEDAIIRLSDAQAKAAGITVQSVGAGRLMATTDFPGEIHFNADRTAHVVPRLAGVAEAVSADLGQVVGKGQVLAVIASTALSELRSELLSAQRRREAAALSFEREHKLWEDKISARQDFQQAQTALQEADIAVHNAAQKLAAVGATALSKAQPMGLNRFEVRAPFGGTVVEKHLSLGESVREDASIFTVSDLGSVWAEFAVSPRDLAALRVGQKVRVSSSAFDGRAEGTISYIGALLGEQTRTARARVTLTNPGGAWRPGLFVTVAVLGKPQDVALAVGVDAVQMVDGRPVAFKAVAGGFAPTPIRTGRSDSRSVEVLEGLRPGDRVAAGNSFVLKAELGKGSAEHEH